MVDSRRKKCINTVMVYGRPPKIVESSTQQVCTCRARVFHRTEPIAHPLGQRSRALKNRFSALSVGHLTAREGRTAFMQPVHCTVQ